MKSITATVQGAAPASVSIGTPARELLPAVSPEGLPVLGVIINNRVLPLDTPLITDCNLAPLTLRDRYGRDIYAASLCFLLAKAAHEIFPSCECRVRNTVGSGIYCTLDWPDTSEPVLNRHVLALKAAMAGMVKRSLPITYEIVSYETAVRRFEQAKLTDKLNLLAHRNPPTLILTCCDGHWDLSQTALVPNTSFLSLFDLVPHAGGFVLNMPDCEHPAEVPPLPPFEHRFDVYREHIEWGRIVGITTVGQLNQAIIDRRAADFVQTIEALHSKKLGRIADMIVARKPRPRLVLIAGPSSAGKTTTAKRLITHLRVNGLKPILLSTDDYFVGDDRNPRDENGKLDYEHIEAMDLPRLNSDLTRLLAGESVRMRAFNFKTHSGYDRPSETTLPAEGGIMVMEGLHCLNPRLTSEVPASEKFLIYLNTLTQLCIDSSNRISTTDTRLIRRIVRDYQFRGRTALETLRMWKSVQRGEQRWIYPFEHLADCIFNSALDYELAVLKPLAAPLLNQVKPWDVEYIEARRLSGILHNFSTLPTSVVPGDSILRETIGDSLLEY